MRKIAAVGSVVTMLCGVAFADGQNPLPPPRPLPPPGPMPPPGVYQYSPIVRLYSWNGPYVGGHLGGALDDVATDSVASFVGGGQVGLNLRVGRAVVGLEAQLTGSAGGGEGDVDVVFPNGATGCLEPQLDWIATVSARLGLVRDRSMLYVKAGAAWAHNSYDALVAALPGAPAGVTRFEGDDTRTGLALGVGYEYAFRSAWSARLEYLFMDFGSDEVTLNGPAGTITVSDVDQQVHAITFSVNYRFDWPIPGPLGTPE